MTAVENRVAEKICEAKFKYQGEEPCPHVTGERTCDLCRAEAVAAMMAFAEAVSEAGRGVAVSDREKLRLFLDRDDGEEEGK